MNQRALLLVNRHARRGQTDLSRAIDRLRELDFELLEVPLESSEQISKVIRQHKDAVDLVIIGGGDGTLNAAIDGLIATQLPLGILPLGTANDLARTLQLPTSLAEACDVIAKGQLERIDLGCVNGNHFFNVASLGLGLKITQRLSRDIKLRWGVFAYAIAAMQVLIKSVPFAA